MSDRWTDDIVAGLTGPDAPGLDAEQRRHLDGCRACRAAVRRAERLDDRLDQSLRRYRTSELPRTVLAAPVVRRRGQWWQGSASILAVGATLGLAAIATGIALQPPALPTPAPVGVSGSQAATASPVASSALAPPALPALEVGRIVAVVNEPDVDIPLVVRTEPGTADPSTITPERLYTGQRVRLIDGPIEANGYPWYEVTVGEVRGWVAAEEKDGSAPWLAPLTNGEILYTTVTGDLLETTDADGSSAQLFAEAAVAPSNQDCQTGTTSQWSADGSFALITSIPTCGEGTIVRVDADGTDASLVAEGVAAALSTDGTRIAFAQPSHAATCAPPPCGAAAPDELHILTLRLDATAEPRPLSGSEAVPYVASDPAWAPDGKAVAFTAQREGRVEVAVFDGSRVHIVAEGFSPVWSPDGKWIAFARDAAGDGVHELHRVRPDGGDPEPIGPGDPGTVSFSPDGQWIGRSITAADGSVVVAVARFERDAPVGTVLGRGGGLVWSPDGDYVAWSEPGGDGAAIWIARSDGSDARRVGTGRKPAWRPIIGE